MGIKSGKSCRKKHKYTPKLKWCVSTFKEVIFNQKGLNIYHVESFLLCFHINYSLLIHKDLCECRNISGKFLYVYLFCSVRIFPFVIIFLSVLWYFAFAHGLLLWSFILILQPFYKTDIHFKAQNLYFSIEMLFRL